VTQTYTKDTMNKQQIITKLKNHNLDEYTRETLQQRLHHLTVQEQSAKRPKKNSPKKKL
jgi:hypothetical protein